MWEGVCFRGSLNIVIPILSVGPSRCGFVSKRMYKYRQYFLLRDASLLWQRVWMSHAGIVSKRLEISSNFFLGLVALPLWFSNTALLLRNSNGKGRTVTRVDLEIFGLITLSNGSAVRLCGCRYVYSLRVR